MDVLTVLADREVVLLHVTTVIHTAATTHLTTISITVVVVSRLDIYSLVHDVVTAFLLVVVDANDPTFDELGLVFTGET